MRSLIVILKLAGAFIAFLMGSGFATGQETLQFFVAYGLWGIGGALIFGLSGAWLATSLLLAGQRHGLRDSESVFRHYAGPFIGTLFAWYTVVAVYSVYVVMLAGAGAVLREYLGLPAEFGAALVALAVLATLYFGLHELVEVIGAIGPLLIALLIFIASAALLDDPQGVATGNAIVPSLELLRAAPNWWISGIIYTGLCVLGLAALLPPLGASLGSRRELLAAGITGPLLFSLALVLVTLALLAGLPESATRMIPMLHVASTAVPLLAPLYSWIIVTAIFTTAAPLLWIALTKFAPDGSARYRLLAIALSVLGYLAGISLPFDRLLNLIYPTIGWSGLLLILFMLLRQVRARSIDG